MALQVIVKNSSVSGNEPTAGQLANGELALNYHANGPFITCKDTAGVVRRVAGVWVNATAPSSPMPGEFWLDISVSPPQLKVYKDGGDAWVPAITVYAATTSVAGVIELATNAETQTGTETNRAVTPASLQSKLTAITGDVTFNASDVSTIAELAVSKLADGSARQLLQTDAAGTGVEWASNIDIPGTLDVTSAATFDGAVTIAGNLTVNGTTTNINTVNLTVEDKNIIIADVATPTDVTADGGGITLKGTTDKTINWIDATDAWTLSEHVNIASAKEYRIAGTKVLDATSLGSAVVSSSLTSVGTIGTGVWQGTAIADTYLGTISTALKVSNSATTATSSNTASAIVARDASGNFTAGTITASLTGTASGNLVSGGALGTPSSGTLTNCTFPTLNQNTTGNAATVTTNANLTGDVTSVGNATSIAAGVIVDADINASAAIVDTKLATIATAGKVSNSATTATDANTASAIVTRDASGNFTAGTITAALTGAASSNVLKAGDTMTGVLAVTAGTAALPAITPSGDPNTGIYSPGADQLAISTNGTSRLSIDASGNIAVDTNTLYVDAVNNRVGIGTSDPTSGTSSYYDDLVIKNTTSGSGAGITIQSNSTNGFSGLNLRKASGDELGKFVGDAASGKVYIESAGGAAITLDSSQRVGIGTTSPAYKLDIFCAQNDGLQIYETSSGNNRRLRITQNAGGVFYDATYSTGLNAHAWGIGSGEVARIDSSGRLLVGTIASPAHQLQVSTDSAGKPSTNTWTIVSDERIKEDIELADLDLCYQAVKNIPLKRFKWKDEVYTEEQVRDRRKLGWIAQDVEAVFPKAVGTYEFKYNQVFKEIIIPAVEEELDDDGNITTPAQPERIEKGELISEDVIEDCRDLNSDQLYAAMYGAIQKLMIKVEVLETEIASLKAIG